MHLNRECIVCVTQASNLGAVDHYRAWKKAIASVLREYTCIFRSGLARAEQATEVLTTKLEDIANHHSDKGKRAYNECKTMERLEQRLGVSVREDDQVSGSGHPECRDRVTPFDRCFS